MKSNRLSAAGITLSILLTIVAAGGCKKKQAGPPPSPTPDYIPGRFELGVNIHTNATSRVDDMKEMGAEWVRIDIEWCELETDPGTVNFAPIDAAVENARRNGLQVYAHIQCTPEFAVENGQRPWTGVPKKQYWTSFVENVATHFRGRIQALGIWNEPNLNAFWTGSARDYAESLVKPAAPVIRRVAPGMLVVGPDLAHLYKGDINMQDFYNTLAQTGAARDLDVIAHHVYGHEDFEPNMMGYHDLSGKDGFKTILNKAGLSGRRVWITEFGVDSKKVGEQKQSEYVYDQVQKMVGWGFIEKAFIYELDDSDYTTGLNYGVLRADGSRKPVWQGLQDILSP